VTLSPRHALIAAVVLLTGCSTPNTAVFPTATAGPSDDAEQPAATPAIDPAQGEQLGMRGTATMTVKIGANSTTETLVQSAQAETVIEQNEGETVRVLRLAVADAKREDDVQFSIDGVAAVGTFKTGEADLRVVFYDAPAGVDLLSDDGGCTVVFDRADTTGAAGTVTCADIETPTGKATLTASFQAQPTDAA
jgi:hypothetical protein